MDSDVLNLLEQYSVSGNEDSSLFDLASLMFCDIPTHYALSGDEKAALDADKANDIEANFDKLLAEMEDTTAAEDFVNTILADYGSRYGYNVDDGNVKGDDGVDKGNNGGDNGGFNDIGDAVGDNGGIGDKSDKDKDGKEDADKGGDGGDLSDKDGKKEGDGDDSGSETDNIGDGNQDNVYQTSVDREDENNSDDSDETDKEDKKDKNKEQDKDNGKPCKSVIVEFAADVTDYTHEPYVWNVKPGEIVNSNTIIAYCKQRNKILPVKSVFSKGVVRKDETDGDFWRCWKTVTSRHIIIDCVEEGGNSFEGSSSVDYSAIYEDEMALFKLSKTMQNVGDIFNIVTNHFIYVTYCHLLYYFGVPRQWWTWMDYSWGEDGEILSSWTVLDYEDVNEDDKPEVVFAKFINDVYRPRVKRYREEIQKAVSVDTIKATKGNPKKILQLGQKAVDLNNEFFYDIVDMYKNCHRYFKRVVLDMDKDDFCRKTWSFLQRMEFEFENMEDDNFKIYKEQTYDKFVKEIYRDVLDYYWLVGDKRDGRYTDYHSYYNMRIGRIFNWNDSSYGIDSSSGYDNLEYEDTNGNNWRVDGYDVSVNMYRSNYEIREYVHGVADDSRSRDYETYYEYLCNNHLKTDTQRELEDGCDAHETHDFLGDELDLNEYLSEYHADENAVTNMVTHKVWAAEEGETISDYFIHITKEIFNNGGYFTMKYKSLLDYFINTHNHFGDQRWKIAEEVRRFDELFDCMVGVYGEYASTNIDGSKTNTVDYLRNKIRSMFKEKVIWPTPSEYYYEPTSEFFYRHYVFQNDDEIEQIYDPKKAEIYIDDGTAIGDEAQLDDYKDNLNLYTGYVPQSYSEVYDEPSGSPNDVDFIPTDDDSGLGMLTGDLTNIPNLVSSLQDIIDAKIAAAEALNGGNGVSDTNNDADNLIASALNGSGGNNGDADGEGGNGGESDLDNDRGSGGNGSGNGDSAAQSDGSGSNGNGTDVSGGNGGNGNNGSSDGNGGEADGDGDNGASDDTKDNIKDKAAQEKEDRANNAAVDITKYKYWVRYFAMATLCTMMFLGCGIPLPCMTCIPLPCIYIPIVVISLTKVGIIIVIGIAIRGVFISPIMLFVNMKSAENSMLIPVSESMELLRDMMQAQVDQIQDMAKQAAALEAAKTKLLLVAQMKLAKEYEAKTKALRAVEVEGKKSITDNFKQALGLDLKQTLTRMKKDAEAVAEEVKSEAVGAANDVADAASEVGSIVSSNKKADAVSNTTISPSVT